MNEPRRLSWSRKDTTNVWHISLYTTGRYVISEWDGMDLVNVIDSNEVEHPSTVLLTSDVPQWVLDALYE